MKGGSLAALLRSQPVLADACSILSKQTFPTPVQKKSKEKQQLNEGNVNDYDVNKACADVLAGSLKLHGPPLWFKDHSVSPEAIKFVLRLVVLLAFF